MKHRRRPRAVAVSGLPLAMPALPRDGLLAVVLAGSDPIPPGRPFRRFFRSQASIANRTRTVAAAGEFEVIGAPSSVSRRMIRFWQGRRADDRPGGHPRSGQSPPSWVRPAGQPGVTPWSVPDAQHALGVHFRQVPALQTAVKSRVMRRRRSSA